MWFADHSLANAGHVTKNMTAHATSLAIASLQNYWPQHCFIKQQYNYYIVFGQHETV